MLDEEGLEARRFSRAEQAPRNSKLQTSNFKEGPNIKLQRGPRTVGRDGSLDAGGGGFGL
jgi:hypothetical protein